jgi:hypothetical protein
MIKRALEYFPLWSDIRKRSNKSVGGRMISSFVDEIVKVEDDIQKYIDSYFLYNYIGHEDEVMAYVYMAKVGNIKEQFYLSYNNELFFFASTIEEFEKRPNLFFYEEGKIYLKVEDHIEDVNTITLLFDNNAYSEDYELKKVSVWNIFDEYATFVNTRRYENESNKSLLERILYITENLPNGTEDGIKHAIISELKAFTPDIDFKEIKIERPTAENLIKPYEDYEALLDLLAEVNKDIYRTKRWDIDYWEYDFESISYMPHVWDKLITNWKNGVGSYNDLNVILADQIDSTDATIYFYKKTLEAFQKYIYDKYINHNIHFKLTKYNDILNRIDVKYKVTASELTNITNENIFMKIYESNKVDETIAIQDIAVDWGRNIVSNDYSIIDDTNDYYLNIESGNTFDLSMSKINVIYINKITEETEDVLNLMEERDGFVLNSDYDLYYKSNTVALSSIEHFTSTEGLMNGGNYITIEDGYNEGSAIYSLTNKGGMYINYDFDCDTVDVPKSHINSTGGYWNNEDRYIIRGDYSTENKLLRFAVEANYLSFNIDAGANSTISLTVEDDVFGKSEHDISRINFFEVQKTSTPRLIFFTINVLSINDVQLFNFKYNNYEISINTKYGSLEETDKGYRLSNFYTNELRVNLSSRSGQSPILKTIWIGESKEVKYKTSAIPYRANCYRLFEVRTNGKIYLHHLNGQSAFTNSNGSPKEFNPVMAYSAKTDDNELDNAYLRIDLSAYEAIDSVVAPNDCPIRTIEESGKTYYNLFIPKSAGEISTIRVKGTRIKAARIIELEDMVKFYVPDFNRTYDSVYSCKCSKGLIIGRTNPGGNPYNIKINIKSDAFKGINAIKYEMNLPTHLGCIYGSNNGGEVRSLISNYTFDYVSIYPAASDIYVSVNTEPIYTKSTRWIPITNNFDKPIDLKKLMFYSIEPLKNDELMNSIVIKFHNELTAKDTIYDLNDWSIGTSDSYIAIENNNDLSNNIVYNITTYNVNEEIQLSSAVDIKDSYTLTNQTILNTEQFIVSTDNKDIEIKYEYYDGTPARANFVKYQTITVKSDGFNKLLFSNIDTIFHISTEAYSGEFKTTISDYNLLKDEGIIIWNDQQLIDNNAQVHLVYTIKKPVAFVFGLDYLYNIIDYDVEAYSMYHTEVLKDQKNKSVYDLTKSQAFNDADLIYVSCSEPTFKASLENNKITFDKHTELNSILVKTGYYYINGREYYLFSEQDKQDVKNAHFYEEYNTDASGGEFVTYVPTNNFVSNSEMRLDAIGQLYNFDCTQPLTYGISTFNNLTSCETINNWNTFGMKVKLTEGLNGLGLEFTSEIPNGYSFIDITDSLVDGINYVSFFASKNLKVYFGQEEFFLGLNFERALNIKIQEEIEHKESNIRFIAINKTMEVRYYLLVQGTGILDDIIISTDSSTIFSSHTKNISLLDLVLYDKRPQGSQFKMLLENNKDYISEHASLMSDGSIKTTSSVDWYITKIIDYSFDEQFKQCDLYNVGVNFDYIYTADNGGYIETPPIFLNDIDNIKRLIFKINDVDFDNMQGFLTSVYTSNKSNGEYALCTTSITSNRFYLSAGEFNKYIKFKIQMPIRKFIKSIQVFAEYYADNDNPLNIVMKQSGSIISKVYDLQEITDCRVRSIDLEDISNINDVRIQIRASRDTERLDVWTEWNEIKLNTNNKIANQIVFKDARFLQFKITLKNRDAYIKLKGINIEIN